MNPAALMGGMGGMNGMGGMGGMGGGMNMNGRMAQYQQMQMQAQVQRAPTKVASPPPAMNGPADKSSASPAALERRVQAQGGFASPAGAQSGVAGAIHKAVPAAQATPRSDLDALSYVWSNVTLSVLDVGEARAAGAESAAARRARVKALNCMIQVRKMNREKDGWRKKD